MSQLDDYIEVVETSYEFLLAYAAQGREDDNTGPGQKSRDTLGQLDTALSGIVELLDNSQAFHEVVKDDIGKTRKALTLIAALPRISSELIDNLNASMHLRAVLTDLFLISEAHRISASP